MKYPSLIFENENCKTRNDYSVFTDLKLDLLLSEDTLNVISYYVSPEDIARRAEIFSIIENEGEKNRLYRLNGLAKYICGTVNKAENTVSEVSHHILFVTALKYYCDFARSASGPIEGYFGKRFSEYFTDVVNNDLPAFEVEVNRLYGLCSEALKFELSVSPDGAAIGMAAGPSFETELIKCAEYFGAEIEEVSDNTDFINITEKAVNEYGTLASELEKFYDEFSLKFDPSVVKYAGETGFYLEISDLIKRIGSWGIPMCRPVISAKPGITASKVFDYTLIAKNEKFIVPNDISLDGDARFCFLRGANGGGKTTYLRCVGVNTILALCGAKVAAQSFETYDYNKIYTHFPRDERFDRGGRLNDEETRLLPIRNNADEKSLVLLNETFSTTGAKQSDEMTAALASDFCKAGCTGIYVTHAKLDPNSSIAVLCVAIDPDDENRRTFRVEKENGAGSSFAEDILKRYNLDRASLSERFGEI